METICPLPGEPALPESRILHRGCQEREKRIWRVSQSSFFFLHPATGDLYLIPPLLCICSLLFVSVNLSSLPFIHRNFSLVSPPPFSFPTLHLHHYRQLPLVIPFLFPPLLVPLPAAFITCSRAPASEFAVAFHGVVSSARAASRNR